MGNTITIISVIGSVASIIALITQLRKKDESVKVYLLLAIIVLLTAVASFSLARSIELEEQKAKLVSDITITNQTLNVINKIMDEIEIFNNMRSLPDGREDEYIEAFERNIREAAEELRKLEASTAAASEAANNSPKPTQ